MNQLKIKPALEIMRKFIGDSILVAHNASFDYGFLNEAFKNNQQPEMKNIQCTADIFRAGLKLPHPS